jgi:3-isopropylmalate/(R)-2-methylmalate dehydratase small subunit
MTPQKKRSRPCAPFCYDRAVAKYEDLIAGEDALLAVTGRAWVFGDRVRREHVLADEHLKQPPSVARQFAMAVLDPQFAARVAPGDFIVAGLEFAADALQRSVPAALKSLGLGGVIARSFGDRFERNAIHVGLPVLVVEETAAIKTGDHLRVDVEAHIVANLSSGDRYVVRNLDDAAIAILRAGGRG